MPDNIAVTPGVGASVRTDLVGTDHYQVIKLDGGGDGVAVPIVAGQQTMAASLPVTIASNQAAVPSSVADGSSVALGATTDAAVSTDAAGTVNAHLRGLVVLIVNFLTRLPAALGAGGGLKVDGSGTALPISAADLPLPTGAASAVLQGAGLPATLGAGGGLKVDGSGTALPISVVSLPLPAGASTEALQGGGLPAALGAGGGLKVDGSGTALPVSGTVIATVAPPATFVYGKTTVETATTHVTLGASATLTSGIRIKALHANTGWIYVGLDGVAAASGFVLDAGEEVFIEVADRATVFLDASVSGEGVTYIGS